MHKLKLALDTLVVQSFETAENSQARGTIEAHDSGVSTGGPYYCPADCGDSGVRPTCGAGDTCGLGGLC
jgi:hypothetical protein